MADNASARYADLDTNSIGPFRFVDIGGVLYAVSILAKADGTLLSTFPVSGTIDLGAVDNAVLDAIAASVASTDTILTAATSTNAGTAPTLGLQLGYIDEQSGNFYLVSNSNGGGLPVTSGAGMLSVTLDGYNIPSLPVTGVGGGSVSVTIDDSQILSLPMEGRIAHDSNIGNLTPVVIGGRAYAAAPADVSADADVVFPWLLRNGSGVTNLAVGGTLVTGSAGLPVAQQGTWTLDVVKTDDTAFNPATDKVIPGGFVFDDTTPDTVDEGDVGYARMSAGREQYTVIRDAFGNERGAAVNYIGELYVTSSTFITDNTLINNVVPIAGIDEVSGNGKAIRCTTSRELKVCPSYDGTKASTGNGVSGAGVQRVTIASDSTGVIAVTQSGTWSITLPTGASTATNQTTVQAPVTPAAATATKTNAIGGQYNTTPTTFTDGQQGIVQLGPAGSIRVSTDVDALSATCKQSTASNLKALVNINTGQTAHDSAATNDPVRIGAKAETSMSGITLVNDGDATDIYSSEDGAVYTRNFPAHPSDYIDATPTTITSSTSDTSIVSAAASGVRVYLTGIVINNRHATTKTDISLKDGSGGTVKAILPAPSAGGATYYFDPPLRGSAATAWHAACRDSIASIDITPIGFKSKV